MTTQQILQLESEKEQSHILLFEEGAFLKAYNQSACLFHRCVKPYMLKKHYVKAVDKEIVSVGFPQSAMSQLPLYKGMAKVHVMALDKEKTSALQDYESWVQSIPLSEVQKPLGTVLSEQSEKLENLQCDVIRQLKEFPIESKTPMECMLFLSSLKKEI